MNLGPQVYSKTILGFGVIVDLRNLLSIVLYRLSWPFNSTSPFQLNPSHELLNLFKYFPSKIKYFLVLKSLYSSSYHPITLFTANLKEASHIYTSVSLSSAHSLAYQFDFKPHNFPKTMLQKPLITPSL